MPEQKSLKELCTIRDALKDLISHKDWFGPDEILYKTLARAEGEIKERYEDKNYCSHCGAEVSDDGYSIDPDKACYYCKLD